jgi:hypothetical protein
VQDVVAPARSIDLKNMGGYSHRPGYVYGYQPSVPVEQQQQQQQHSASRSTDLMSTCVQQRAIFRQDTPVVGVTFGHRHVGEVVAAVREAIGTCDVVHDQRVVDRYIANLPDFCPRSGER